MLRIKVTKKLRDFCLDVEIESVEGETVVLMGSNGSGKTTVMNMVAGLASPDSGTIEACGKTLFSSENGIDVPPEGRDIGYMFQNYALFPHLSVQDNVAFGLRMRKIPREEREQKVQAELEAFGLWELRDVKASRLSGGQKQKVALARCLIIKPVALLLDEPLSALDAQTHASFRESLRARLKKDRIPGIIVLHSLRDGEELGDRICIMDRGQVLLSGKPSEVLRQGQNETIDNLLT